MVLIVACFRVTGLDGVGPESFAQGALQFCNLIPLAVGPSVGQVACVLKTKHHTALKVCNFFPLALYVHSESGTRRWGRNNREQSARSGV